MIARTPQHCDSKWRLCQVREETIERFNIGCGRHDSERLKYPGWQFHVVFTQHCNRTIDTVLDGTGVRSGVFEVHDGGYFS